MIVLIHGCTTSNRSRRAAKVVNDFSILLANNQTIYLNEEKCAFSWFHGRIDIVPMRTYYRDSYCALLDFSDSLIPF